MNQTYSLVLEFHQTFRLLPPPPNFEAIRRKMIRDEAEELLTADTPAKLHDWICDMIYFVMGGYVELGITMDHAPYWRITGHEAPDDATRVGWFGCAGELMHKFESNQGEMLRHMQAWIEAFAGMIGYPMADFRKDFAQVHAANMRKVWTGNDLLHQVALFDQHHQEKDGSHTSKDGWNYLRIDESRWIVKHEGKIQKPPGWSLKGGAV